MHDDVEEADLIARVELSVLSPLVNVSLSTLSQSHEVVNRFLMEWVTPREAGPDDVIEIGPTLLVLDFLLELYIDVEADDHRAVVNTVQATMQTALSVRMF